MGWKQNKNTFGLTTSICLFSAPLCSVDDSYYGERDGHQEAVIQTQQHRRHKGNQPDDLREKEGRNRNIQTESVTAASCFLHQMEKNKVFSYLYFVTVTAPLHQLKSPSKDSKSTIALYFCVLMFNSKEAACVAHITDYSERRATCQITKNHNGQKKVQSNTMIRSDKLTSSILLVLHRAGMSLNCLNIPNRFTMMMAASAVWDTRQKRIQHENTTVQKHIKNIYWQWFVLLRWKMKHKLLFVNRPQIKIKVSAAAMLSCQTGSLWLSVIISTHLRERLEDETDGNDHQQHHERRQQPCDLNTKW